jgi:tRNA-dihydrouridine synthase B
MTHLRKPFSLGGLQLPNNIFYAPLAGCTDLPFRRMASAYNPGLMFCEMVKMDALARNDVRTLRLLEYDEAMRPLGAQIFGGRVECAGPAARIIEELGFDSIDLNCGCPVKKVVNDRGGASLLKDPSLIGDLIAEMVAHTSIPVTAKIRVGWDEESINVEEVVRTIEAAGAVAVTVHGRTRAQGYRGEVNYEYIRRAKQAAKKIPVIGNGDIFDVYSAEKMFEETGCDGILVARGMLGKPWIAREIYSYLGEGIEPMEHDDKELREVLLRHFHYGLECFHEQKALIIMRKMGCWYFKGRPRARDFRSAMSRVSSPEEVYRIIDEFFPLS